MNRKTATYLAFFVCTALVGISAAPLKEARTQTPEPLVLNLERVEHVYTEESYVRIIDSQRNVIIDDSMSLGPFFEKLLRLRSGSDEVVSIVHLGDSHVQAGSWDARLRELLQADFGNAGPGLIVPHKLSGSNEPRGYAILTKEKYVSGRATSRDLAEKTGFTGVAVGISSARPLVKIWSKEPFSSVTILHHSKAPLLREPDSLSIGSYCTLGNSERSTRIDLAQAVDSLALQGTITDGFNNPTLYGFSLENGDPGVLLHSVGVNSAAFEHFERNTDFAEGGARDLAPDLIIISLGTNNCFGGNYKSSAFGEMAVKFFGKIRENYPGVAVLITTPMEGCRRSYRTYSVNKNVADVAGVLESIASENEMACWNLHDAAGGANSSAVWHGRRLMQNDHLHMTEEGYALQGDMLYDAIVRSYNDYLHTFADTSDYMAPGDMKAPEQETVEVVVTGRAAIDNKRVAAGEIEIVNG